MRRDGSRVLDRCATGVESVLSWVEFAPPPDLATWVEAIALARPPDRVPGRKWRIIADARPRVRLALDAESRCRLVPATLVPYDLTLPDSRPHLVIRFTPWSQRRLAGPARDVDGWWTVASGSWMHDEVSCPGSLETPRRGAIEPAGRTGWAEPDVAGLYQAACAWLRRTLPDREPDPRVATAWRILMGASCLPNVRELAGLTGTSPRTLQRAFRNECIGSPAVAQQIERMRTALRLLRADLEKTWTRAALEAGFCDQSHFNRAFQQWTGMAPGRFFAEGHHHANDVFARRIDRGQGDEIPIQAIGSPVLRPASERKYPARHHRRAASGSSGSYGSSNRRGQPAAKA
jgi:AraC-like DNA-binding protein